MFSQHFLPRWAQVLEWEKSAPDYADAQTLSDTRAPALFIRSLWRGDFGTGSTFDRQVSRLAAAQKESRFASRLYGIVPLYVTSICSERCIYCNYRADNKGKDITRLRLRPSQLEKEAQFLVGEKNLRVIELVYATDPKRRVDGICRDVELTKQILEEHGGGMVGINAEAFEANEYQRLITAGIDFAVLWQETYDPGRYGFLHPGATKKTKFFFRMDAYERMLDGGLKRFGMGVLSGLSDWRRDWAMLISHEAYLTEHYGIGPSILGIPRLKPVAGASFKYSAFTPSRDQFTSAVALHNLFAPDVLPFVNTREDWKTCLELVRGGGALFTFNCSTIPGGYSLGVSGMQFPTNSFDVAVASASVQSAGYESVLDWTFDDLLCPPISSGCRLQESDA